MNSVTHFLTGYLIGRTAFKKKNDHFIPYFCGLVAIIPDIDQFLYLLFPIPAFEHAVFTHTIIGMFLITFLFTIMNWAIGHKFLKDLDINFKLLMIIALYGMVSHLILDIFTFHKPTDPENAHLYFWPVWNFSFHINMFIPESTVPNLYFIRILIEVIYTAIIGIYIIFYQWAYKKENPFSMFNPILWLNYLPEAADKDRNRRYAYSLSIFNFILLGLILIGIVVYF